MAEGWYGERTDWRDENEQQPSKEPPKKRLRHCARVLFDDFIGTTPRMVHYCEVPGMCVTNCCGVLFEVGHRQEPGYICCSILRVLSILLSQHISSI